MAPTSPAWHHIGALISVALVTVSLQSSAVRAQAWNWAVSEGLTKERVIGLLDLPEIVGRECRPVPPATLALYDTPSKTERSTKSIDTPRRESCQILMLRLDNNAEEELPTDESSSETPAAIVYQRTGLWFRIALQRGSAWVLRTDSKDFLSYPELLRENLSYLGKGWNGKLWSSPGASATKPLPLKWKDHAKENIPLTFIGVRRVADKLWIHVRLENEVCGESLEGVKPVEGWLPAYRSTGQPSAWFYSRGC